MGYTTDFSGSLSLSRPATEVEKNYLDKFSDTRRMKRNVEKLHEMFKGEGGKWGWPAIGQVFTKTDGKLLGEPAAIKQVKEIVSEEYFQKNFGTLNN
jgi:hypothetical protein